MKRITELMILETKKEKLKLKEKQGWQEFTREEFLMQKKQSTLIIFQFINLSLYPILMTTSPHN
jgi:nitrate reductase NapE component